MALNLSLGQSLLMSSTNHSKINMKKFVLPFLLVSTILTSCSQKTEEEISTTIDSAAEKISNAAKNTVDSMGIGDSSATMDRQEIKVTLSDFKIDMPMELKAGQTRFNITNTGKVEHSFELEGNDGNADAKNDRLMTNLDAGDSTHLDVDLRAGTYTVYCPVGNHAGRGMKHTVTVK